MRDSLTTGSDAAKCPRIVRAAQPEASGELFRRKLAQAQTAEAATRDPI